MSDKPATATYAEAVELEKVVAAARVAIRTDAHLCRICAGPRSSGDLRRTESWERFARWRSNICRDGSAEPIETTGQKQAAWRADPAQSGPGGCIGDIGVHAFHLVEYVTGLKVTELNASLLSVVPGRQARRRLHGAAALRQRHAWIVLLTSQIAAGRGKRTAPPRLWREGIAGLAAGRPKPLACEVAGWA